MMMMMMKAHVCMYVCMYLRALQLPGDPPLLASPPARMALQEPSSKRRPKEIKPI